MAGLTKRLLAVVLALGFHGTVHADPKSGSDALPATSPRPEKLVVASSNNFPPLNMLNGSGELEGFGRELSDAVFRSLDIPIERLHSGKWTEVLRWLDSGRADVIHDTGYTPEREDYLDYTSPILTMDEVIFVGQQQIDIHDLKSLTGKKVACVDEHITHLYLKQFDWIDCQVVTTPADAVRALVDGEVDAFIYPREIVLYHLQAMGAREQVKVTGDVLRRLSWSMTVKRGNRALVKLLNQGIKDVKESGKYDRIYNRWFGTSVLVGYTEKEVWLITLSSTGAVLGILLAIGLALYSRVLKKAKAGLEETLATLHTTQSALAASEEKHRLAMEAAHDGLWDWDVTTGHVYFSPGWNRILEEQVVADRYEAWEERIHPEDKRCVLGTLREHLNGETPAWHEEHRLRNASGDWTWVLGRGQVVERDTKGKPLRMVGTMTNISKRKHAEGLLAAHQRDLERTVATRTEELNDANRLLHAVLDTIPARVFWKDRQGRFLGCNHAFLEDAGLEHEDQILGKTDQELPWVEQAEAYRADDHRVMTTGQSRLGYEEPQTTTSGETIWLETSKIPLRDADGVVYGVLGTYQDISGRKESERLLIDAKEAAETANQAKSTFLANMSHELRTPLNAIVGMADVLRRTDLRPEQLDRLDKIEAAGRHLNSIINDILDLSKIEAGKLELEETDVRLGDIVSNVVAMVQDRIEDARLEFVVEPIPSLPRLLGDPMRLQQALLNYLNNAAKFTERGKITLRVLVGKDDTDSMVLRFEVQDTGIGIASEVLPKVFLNFEQADKAITRKYGGSGLGLAINRRLAQLMGGDVGASSAPGMGSTFWFTARLRKGTPIVSESAAEFDPKAARDAIQREHRGRCVLLVDDEPFNREIAEIYLAEVGLEVDIAADGEEAVRLASDKAYDLILMDMQMPKLDGLQATRAIRELPDRDKTPVIAMTANVFPEDRVRCLDAGMNDFVAKPFSSKDFLTTLRKWLGEPHG